MKSTGYERYSQIQLHSLFSTDNWNQLNFKDRINACQEIENRYASENNVQPCNVIHEQMNGASYGWQKGNTICLNTSLVRDGLFLTIYTDSYGQRFQIKTPALAPNWNTLNTLYHEGTHGIQEATFRTPSTYIYPDMDIDLYRIQGIEKEAYDIGQNRTLNAIFEVEQALEKYDPSRNEYFASIKNNSLEAALQDASQHYNDPQIENTLQSVISNRENGISPEFPSLSYQAINNLCDNYDINLSSNVSKSTSNIKDNSIFFELQSNHTKSIQISEENNEISKKEFLISTNVDIDDGIDSFYYDHSSNCIRSENIDDGINYYNPYNNNISTNSHIDDGISSSSNINKNNNGISNDSSEMSIN